MDQFNAGGAAAFVHNAPSEEAIFNAAGMAYIPPFLREGFNELALARQQQLPQVIAPGDIKGIIHSHSSWSDGESSLEEMAAAAKAQGFEYLVISDHSRSAFYANGLSIERVLAQHEEIDALNKKLAPFRIFKSIESDILNDGTLDYPDEILVKFDLVIASVHSNLKMTEEKAMARLLKAIENPYTTVLGHMTGRLLLSRNGYPVDHKAVIDACAANNVVIELNAHPRRLDIDWTWLPYALEKNVLISIDPDAHSIHGYLDIHYGTLAAQKGGVTQANNLSSFTAAMLDDYLLQRRQQKNTR
jgi:DNA polymerase (family 10)